MSDQEKNKRLVIIIPESVYNEFQELTEAQYTTMSAVGRRLILEWLAEQDRPPGRPKGAG